jgi:murein DD-endopeptidase MepM/ murein hydrolase activator NlpD
MLAPHRLHTADVTGVVTAAARVFDLRKLRAGQPWRFERTLDGCVRHLEYEVDAERFLRVSARANEAHGFDASVIPYDVRQTTMTVAGIIDSHNPSLFAAMAAEGETPELPMALAAIFGGEVDFNTDLQRGDGFGLVVEKIYREGRFARYGTVQAAELRNAGRRLLAIRYAPPGAAFSYYDTDGKSLKRFFLRSPLRFEPQVTSRFSLARFHPVLHRMRAHLGVDYRAPVGAPVVAVASGVVTSAGRRGGAGNMVSIRHPSGYESSYLHLSAITRGIRPGAHVAQGQMIGRVGATGLATGPHLDYRLAKNGRFINPLLEHGRMPPGSTQCVTRRSHASSRSRQPGRSPSAPAGNRSRSRPPHRKLSLITFLNFTGSPASCAGTYAHVLTALRSSWSYVRCTTRVMRADSTCPFSLITIASTASRFGGGPRLRGHCGTACRTTVGAARPGYAAS